MFGIRLRHAAFLSVLSGFPLSAQASPLNRGWVPAESTWLVHVDIERLLSTDFGRFIRQQIEQAELDEGDDQVKVTVQVEDGADDGEAGAEIHIKAGADAHGLALEAMMPQSLADFRAQYGFDPLTDVLGVTIFGTNDQPEEGTIIVHTTAAIDKAFAELDKVEGVEVSQMRGATVSRLDLGEGEAPKFIAVRPEAGGTRMMFFAESVENLVTVLAPGGVSRGPEWAEPAGDSFIYVHASKDSPFAKEAVHSHLLRDAESMELNIGQRGEEMYVDGVLEAGDAAIATNIAQVGNGLMALARLGAMQDEALDAEAKAALDLTRNLAIRAEGSVVTLKMSFESAKLLSIIEQGAGVEVEADAEPEATPAE